MRAGGRGPTRLLVAGARWLHSPGFAGMGAVREPKDWQRRAKDAVVRY